mgnify:CR=1 FL=1
MERVIETELLSGIVERYSRGVKTLSIVELSAIELEDCKYIDGVTRYAHSQSLELPIVMPEPNELEHDFKELQDWD